MKQKILLIFVLFTISLFGQFKAHKDGFIIKMESEQNKNVICYFILFYNESKKNDTFIIVDINLAETNKPTKINFNTLNGNLSIPCETHAGKVIVGYIEADKRHSISFWDDETIRKILYSLASKDTCFIQIHTQDTFYNFDFTKYNDKMKENKTYNDAMTRLIYNTK